MKLLLRFCSSVSASGVGRDVSTALLQNLVGFSLKQDRQHFNRKCILYDPEKCLRDGAYS